MGKGEWIDCHVHVLDGGTEQAGRLVQDERARGYAASNFLSVEGMGDAAQNALAIYYKLADPGCYAFGGMHYRFAYDFGEEAERLHAIGLDGIKMIENKPTERIKLGYAQNDPRYDSLYRTLVRLNMPLLAHVGDPEEFWRRDQIPSWAMEAGYFYGEGDYPGFWQLVEETTDMLERHPDLRVCFAHFLFLAGHHDRLSGMMEKYPNLYLDITAGTEMYFSFSRDPALWRNFFLKYRNRILFGTDNCNAVPGEETCNMDITNALERNFLCRDDLFEVWDKQVQGIGLQAQALERITVENFRDFAGKSPRPVNRRAAAEYLQERLSNPDYELNRREREIIYEVYCLCAV